MTVLDRSPAQRFALVSCGEHCAYNGLRSGAGLTDIFDKPLRASQHASVVNDGYDLPFVHEVRTAFCACVSDRTTQTADL